MDEANQKLEEEHRRFKDEMARRMEDQERAKQELIQQQKVEWMLFEEELGREWQELERKLREEEAKKLQELMRRKEEVCTPFCIRCLLLVLCWYACMPRTSSGGTQRFHTTEAVGSEGRVMERQAK